MKCSCLLVLLLVFIFSQTSAQDLYTAKGYWNELNKETYQKILAKKSKGEVLTDNESLYLQDYEQYLTNYYQRMSEDEKRLFESMKEQWNLEAQRSIPQPGEPVDFELRTRDRLVNGLYGAYYGISLVVITGMEDAAAVGIPFITAGLWQLGPIINQKKYEGINPSVIRAGNTGKLLGLGYGAALGLAVGGESDVTGDLALAFSTLGSITMGEIAFQGQKKKNLPEGYIEMMRLYGFLGPGVAVLGVAAANPDNANIYGAALLGGGIAGLLIGNKQARKYNYSMGDVDAIGSLTWITTGLGGAIAIESVVNNSENYGLLLIPAATAITGTIWGQRSVRGAYLTKKQGSAISLSSGGAALVGLGLTALLEPESAGVILGVPALFALITHQAVFHQYKMKNLEKSLKVGRLNRKNLQFSMKVMPENYLTNKQSSEKLFHSTGQLANPIVKLKLTF